MRKSHECHSEPQAKNLTLPAFCKSEILRLLPQDDIATQSLSGEGKDVCKPGIVYILNRAHGLHFFELSSMPDFG